MQCGYSDGVSNQRTNSSIAALTICMRRQRNIHQAALRVLKWSPAVREFLDPLNERVELVAELLADDA
jgi:hypothetical protein